MPVIYIYICLVNFIATLVRSTFGFGEALVAVPLLIIFIPINVAVPFSVMTSILIASVVVVQDHREIHIQSAKWLILSALPGIPVGILILLYGNAFWVKIGLGTLIILYSIYSIFAKNSFRLKTDNRVWLFLCGLLSGILGGAYGLNGPPLAVYGNMRQWSPGYFRATLQAYFLPVSLLGAIGYLAKGLITSQVLLYFVVSLPAVIPAIFLGRYLNRKLKTGSFFKFVYIGLIFIGLLLIFLSIK